MSGAAAAMSIPDDFCGPRDRAVGGGWSEMPSVATAVDRSLLWFGFT